MAEKDGQAASLYKAEQRVAALETRLEESLNLIGILDAEMIKLKRVCDAAENMVRVFGTYRGSDKRTAMGIMTAVHVNAGTIDVLVLDSSYSGGLREDPGIEMGTGLREFMPFMVDEPEPLEVEDDNLVAAKR